jgi:hypothetical protein
MSFLLVLFYIFYWFWFENNQLIKMQQERERRE